MSLEEGDALVAVKRVPREENAGKGNDDEPEEK
jgi:hypothetical protein